jgi:hypothetical protein
MLLSSAASPVRCIEGCGGGGEPTVLALIGLVMAFLSLAIALKAWKVSDSSLAIANQQHQEFLKALQARADFDVSLHLEEHPDWLVETDSDEVRLKLRLVITNSGTKAATDVGVNLLAPAELRDLKSEGKQATTPTTKIEELTASDGSTYPAQYLVELIPRFSLSMTNIKFASAVFDAPKMPGDERLVPLLFRVWSDDMPDDVDVRSATGEIQIRRTA